MQDVRTQDLRLDDIWWEAPESRIQIWKDILDELEEVKPILG